MKSLREALGDYIALRRGLGYRLDEPARLLNKFLAFLDDRGTATITTRLALEWACSPPGITNATRGARLSIVRLFAAYRSTTDPGTEVPPQGLLPYRYERRRPYIYSDVEIARLLEAARQLRSKRQLRARTIETIIGLLAVTGMRVTEIVNLDRTDVDLAEGILTIRRTKFGKTRRIPLHATTTRALEDYSRRQEGVFPSTTSPALFLSERGARIDGCTIRYNFALLSRRIGLRGPARRRYGHGRGPRVHDFRHRFAVKTLLDWYRAGVDVERQLPTLSTFLGHVHVADTYWYLTAVPELLQLVVARLEGDQGGDPL